MTRSRNPVASILAPVFFASLSLPCGAQDQPGDEPRFPLNLFPVRGERGEDIERIFGPRLGAIARWHGKTEADLRTLLRREGRSVRSDRSGRLHFVCGCLDPQAAPPVTVAPPNSAVTTIPKEKTFLLHSRPTATRVIYLDFKGRTVTGTPWNTQTGIASIPVPQYDVDGTVAVFSDKELGNIRAIWQQVAEDYAPFDVDVTTEDPGAGAFTKSSPTDLNHGVRVCIGGDGAWCGRPGGIAYLNTFAWTPNTTYPGSETPAFVFSDNLRTVGATGATVEKGIPKFVADAAAHEVGHTCGLSHDGDSAGDPQYFKGRNNWGPLMGAPYGMALTQWSKGEYTGATNPEDDLKIISSKLPYLPVDLGTGLPGAPVSATGSSFARVARIEGTSQKDYAGFTAAGGRVTLNLVPWALGANIDAKITLYNSAGQVLQSANPANSTSALALGASLTYDATKQDTYFVSVEGVGAGSPTTNYSNYGSLGQYRLNASYTAASGRPPTASFSSSLAAGTRTVTFNAGASSDPDAGGSISRYEWNFGDGSPLVSGAGTVSATRTYAAAGRYTVTLRLTDNTGLVSFKQQEIDVANPSLVKVRSIDMSFGTAPGGKQASAVVTVRNQSNAVVPGAVVTGRWSGLRAVSGMTATTDSKGLVGFKTPDPSTTAGTCTFIVTGISLRGAKYDPVQNAETQDSISLP